jgi:hypothetical protein
MPTMVASQAVLTLLSANLFNGAAYEIAKNPRSVSLAVIAGTAGTFGYLQSGSDVVFEESPILVKTTSPVIPDDFYFNDVQGPMDKLKLQVRNPTGGTVNFTAIAMLSDA